jgi:AcrR family transcriptional regulator
MRTRGARNRATPERRREILDAALDVFLEHGYANASLQAISAKLKVTKGSVYHHFRKKEEIAVVLYSEAIAAIHEVIRQALVDVPSARAGIEGIVLAYLSWFEAHPRLGAFVFEIMDGRSLDAHIESVRRSQRAFTDAMTSWIAPYVQSGEVAQLEPTLYVPLVIGPSRDFLREWLPRRRGSEIEAARRALPIAAWRCIAG